MAAVFLVACALTFLCPISTGLGARDDAWVGEAAVIAAASSVGAPWPGTASTWDAGECVVPLAAQKTLADAQKATYDVDEGYPAMAATVSAVPEGCVLEWPELDAVLQAVMISQAERRHVNGEADTLVSRRLGLGTVYLVVHQYGDIKMARNLCENMKTAGIALGDVLLVTGNPALNTAFEEEGFPNRLFVDAWRLKVWQRKASDDGLQGTGLCARDDAVALRLVVAREILMRGYSVVNSDVDVVWQKPFPMQLYLDADVAYSLYNGPALDSNFMPLKRLWDTVSHDKRVLWHLESAPFCGGLWFYASTPKARRIFHQYFRRAVLDRGETCGDQKAWNTWLSRNRHQFRYVRHGDRTLDLGRNGDADAAVLGMLPVTQFPTAMTWFYGRHGIMRNDESVVAFHLAEFGSTGKDWGLREVGLWRGDHASWFAGRFLVAEVYVPPAEAFVEKRIPYGASAHEWHAGVELQILRLVLQAAQHLGRIPILPAFLCAATPKAGRFAFPPGQAPVWCDVGWHYSWRRLEEVHGPSGFRESRFLHNPAAHTMTSTMQWMHDLPPGSPLASLLPGQRGREDHSDIRGAWARLSPSPPFSGTSATSAEPSTSDVTGIDVLVMGIRVTRAMAKSGLGVRMPPEITDDSLGIAPATREHGCC